MGTICSIVINLIHIHTQGSGVLILQCERLGFNCADCSVQMIQLNGKAAMNTLMVYFLTINQNLHRLSAVSRSLDTE